MITKKSPNSWQDLQQQVGKILAECGFTVEIEKKTTGVRGEVEFDVYAEELVNGRCYRIAVECKYWKARVPQNVVHSFRTTTADMGVNMGYIISMNGFQSGAKTAAELTNVEMHTWEEFQNIFLHTWYDNHFTKRIKELSPLMTYSEPFFPTWFKSMSEQDKELYCDYKRKYDTFGMIAQSFGPWGRVLRSEEALPALPLAERCRDETIPDTVLYETHYRELLDSILEYGFLALNLYRELRFKYESE